jgi:hypothetical protein
MESCLPRQNEQNGFEKNANVPQCGGAIDGKRNSIIKLSFSCSPNYNYKNYFSIFLLGLCGSNYLFTYVEIGAYGSQAMLQPLKKLYIVRNETPSR